MTAVGLDALFAPRSIAVVGASDDSGKYGGRLLSFLLRHGFDGPVVPIHPWATTIQGLPARSGVDCLDSPVDLIVVSVPADSVQAVVADAARSHVGACVILSSGFAEEGPAGRARQDALMAATTGSGLRILGPNCLGIVVPPGRLVLSPSYAFDVPVIPAGQIALVAQSGAVMTSIFNRGFDAGIGLSLGASVGNQADIDVCDVIEYALSDPRTATICAHVEGFRDPRRFAAIATRCAEAGKPLLAVKGGATDIGAKAVSSHTASLAGDYDIFAAVCRDRSVDLLDDPEGMLECAASLARWGRAVVSGVAVVSNSGGHGVLVSDRVARAGLPMADLADATVCALGRLLSVARSPNPVDVGGLPRGTGPTTAARVLRSLLEDPNVGVALVVLTTSVDLVGLTRAIGEVARQATKPVVISVVPGSAADDARDVLRELGLPFVNRVDDAIRVCRVQSPRSASTIRSSTLISVPMAEAHPVAAGPGGLDALAPGPLAISDAEAIVRHAGIRLPTASVVTSQAEAVALATQIGGPVAMKLVANGVTHKSDVGGVRLGVLGDAAVAETWDELQSIVPAPSFIGVQVQEMIESRAELIVGIRQDPGFGPFVLVGAGGTNVEALRDVALAQAPIEPDRGLGLILGLRCAPMLGSWRGRPPADVAAAAEVVTRIGRIATEFGQRLEEFEINPLALMVDGRGAIALDVRGTIGPEPLEEPDR